MKRLASATAVLCLAMQSSVSAQPDHRTEILEVIRVMFDGLHEQDTAKMRATIYEGTRFILTSSRDGSPAITNVPLDAFLAAVANATDALEERYWSPNVVVHDNLASVWVEYAFYRNGQVDHCGEDNFQLARWPDGWKIVAVADTQRRECPTN